MTPDVLICAGLDPSGGAGLIADVRVVSLLGARPVGVVTALTVQDTGSVVEIEPVNADLLRAQLDLLLSDVEVRAVKLGLLGSSAVAGAIGAALALTGAPVVWDPVLRPSRGDVAFIDHFTEAMAALLPHVTLLTPNIPELAALLGTPVATLAEAVTAGCALASRLDVAVLVKGGHIEAAEPPTETPPRTPTTQGAPLGADARAESVDILCHAGGHELLRGPRLPGGEHVHGTGCALSSAIAAHLALGASLAEACRAAKQFVAARLAAPARPGRGAAAVV